MSKSATKNESAVPKPPSARDLYRDECAKVAAGDARWRRRAAPATCPRCDGFSSWVAPDKSATCPGCWDWLSDTGADSFPALEPPRPEPKLPPGASHPVCPKCPAGTPRPTYDWGWDSRGKRRKRVLLSSCSACGDVLGDVEARTFSAYAPPLPPDEPETGDLFAAPAVDPDDATAVGADALDVAGTRDAQVSRAESTAGRLRLRVPVVTATCATCGSDSRGILWPAGMSDAEGHELVRGHATCAACIDLKRAEARAPMGLAWARDRQSGQATLVPVEEVGWGLEGDFQYEPLGYRGVRWADLSGKRATQDARRASPGRGARGEYRDAADAVTGAPMSAQDVLAYLSTVEEAGLDRWAVGRFACGAVAEIRRGKS